MAWMRCLVLLSLFPLAVASSRSATPPRGRTQSSSRNYRQWSASGTANAARRGPTHDGRGRPSKHDDGHGTRPRRKKKKKKRCRPKAKTDYSVGRGDPMDWSSSSCVPTLVYSDAEHEESVLSALARVEESDQEEEQDDDVAEEAWKERSTKKTQHMACIEKEATSVAAVNKTVDTETTGEDNNMAHDDIPERHSMDHTALRTAQAPSTSGVIHHTERVESVTKLEASSIQRPPQASRSGSPQTAVPSATQPVIRHIRPSVSQAPTYASPHRHASTSSPPVASISQPRAAMPSFPTRAVPDSASYTAAAAATTPWVRRFLSTRPRDALLPVPREYLSDGFNLVQLAPIVERIAAMDAGYSACRGHEQQQQQKDGRQTITYPLFKAALRLILQEEEQEEPSLVPVTVQRAAEALYSLVHARYIISPRGLDTVRRAFLGGLNGTVEPVFGKCPRISCRGMPLMPLGDSDNYDYMGQSSTRAKRVCPCCQEKFYMWDSRTDESAWGRSFCHLFLMTYGSEIFLELLKARRDKAGGSAAAFRSVPHRSTVSPSIFGFQVHPGSNLRYPVPVEIGSK